MSEHHRVAGGWGTAGSGNREDGSSGPAWWPTGLNAEQQQQQAVAAAAAAAQQQQQAQQQAQQQQQQQQQQQHSKSYTVENLASSNYTPSINHGQAGNAYSNIIPGPHYPVSMGSTNGYLFGGLETSLMQRTYGMGGISAMGGMHPSLGHMPNPYPYNATYSSSFDAYPTPPTGIHAPSANYPGYPGGHGAPGNSTPPSYLQSHHRPSVDLAYDGV